MLKVLVQPTTEPITLATAKSHLRVDFTDDDTYIEGLISAARSYSEVLQNRSLAPTTLELTLDYFPGTFVDRLYGAYNAFGIYRYSSPVKLPRTPVAAISSIVYTRSDGVDVTMVSTDYILKSSGDIVPSYGKFWPIDVLVPGDAIKVTYTAGYAADEVPKTTIQGMLLLIGHWYEKREAIGEIKMIGKVPFGVENLLWMDRSW